MEAGRNWILRAKTGWEGRMGWWVGWVEWPTGPVFFALNIDTPNRMDDLFKREAIVGNPSLYRSVAAQPGSQLGRSAIKAAQRSYFYVSLTLRGGGENVINSTKPSNT